MQCLLAVSLVFSKRQLNAKSSYFTGAPEEIRTPDPQIRSLVLYPAELRARAAVTGNNAAQAERMHSYRVASGLASGRQRSISGVIERVCRPSLPQPGLLQAQEERQATPQGTASAFNPAPMPWHYP